MIFRNTVWTCSSLLDTDADAEGTCRAPGTVLRCSSSRRQLPTTGTRPILPSSRRTSSTQSSCPRTSTTVPRPRPRTTAGRSWPCPGSLAVYCSSPPWSCVTWHPGCRRPSGPSTGRRNRTRSAVVGSTPAPVNRQSFPCRFHPVRRRTRDGCTDVRHPIRFDYFFKSLYIVVFPLHYGGTSYTCYRRLIHDSIRTRWFFIFKLLC